MEEEERVSGALEVPPAESGSEAHLLEELLEPADGKVADADVLGLALLDELLHGGPGRRRVAGEVPVDLGLALLGLVGERDGPAAGVSLGSESARAGEGKLRRRPSAERRTRGDALHEVEVEVVEPEVVERLLQADGDLVGRVERVPELRGEVSACARSTMEEGEMGGDAPCS